MSLDQENTIVKSSAVTRDAFLSGKIHLTQPKTGFRAGSDSVLLGASVAANATSLLDLGCGVGTAAICAMARIPTLNALLAERDPQLSALATQNIADNNMSDRATCTMLDVTATGKQRLAAGLLPDHYSAVIANPPYFASEAGTPAPDISRAGARAMDEGLLDKWVRTAAAAAAPKGQIIFIYRASGLAELLNAFARFGNVTVLPLCGRPGEAASRVLVRGIKGTRAPMVLKSPLAMHPDNGHDFTQLMQAIQRDGAALDW